MVEYTLRLDSVFGALADPTRRDILKRVGKRELSVGDIAEPYRMSLAAISKHLRVLEKAKLVRKRRIGKQQMIAVVPSGVQVASACLRQYEKLWNDRLDRLEAYLKNT